MFSCFGMFYAKQTAAAVAEGCTSGLALAADQAVIPAVREDYFDCMELIATKDALIDAPMKEVIELADTMCAALLEYLAGVAGKTSAHNAEKGAHYGTLFIIAEKRLDENTKGQR